jgi:hypothetical protein
MVLAMQNTRLEQMREILDDLTVRVCVLENPKHLRECAADGCELVYTPNRHHPRYCSPRCHLRRSVKKTIQTKGF